MRAHFVVTFGACRYMFYTAYHAEQFCRALALNGTAYSLEVRS